MAIVRAGEGSIENEVLNAGGRIGIVRDAHTHASGRNALSDLGAKALVEGDVAFFKDAVEKL
jgi:hypothetical protein